MTAFAPMPRPSVPMTVAARPLARSNDRTAIRMSGASSTAALAIVRTNMRCPKLKLYASNGRQSRGNCPTKAVDSAPLAHHLSGRGTRESHIEHIAMLHHGDGDPH